MLWNSDFWQLCSLKQKPLLLRWISTVSKPLFKHYQPTLVGHDFYTIGTHLDPTAFSPFSLRISEILTLLFPILVYKGEISSDFLFIYILVLSIRLLNLRVQLRNGATFNLDYPLSRKEYFYRRKCFYTVFPEQSFYLILYDLTWIPVITLLFVLALHGSFFGFILGLIQLLLQAFTAEHYYRQRKYYATKHPLPS